MRLRPVIALTLVAFGCAQPSISLFTAEPASVAPGESSQVSWNSQATQKCRLEPLGMDVGTAGALTVSPTATTQYTLTCATVSATTTVTVAERISRFTATPSSVIEGDAVELAWASLSSGCRIEPEPGPVPASGTRSVRPAVSTTFVLTCGAAMANAPVIVSPAPMDPLFSAQWHLLNTGQAGGTRGEDLAVQPAWAMTRGEGVRVAVVDDGVDLAHEDLSANALPAESHDYLGNASVALAEHGTAVAGLAAARDFNGVGGRGVAPRAGLISYNFLQDSTSANELDAMVRGLNTVGVSNNSWGDADDGTGQLTEPDALWLMGVQRGTTEGRGGKGVVYLFPAGNGADGQFPDDANFDGQANSRFVLAIGGVGDDGRRAAYSEPGASVLVCAPAGDRANHHLTTTDITASPGYNDGRTAGEPANASYTQTFNGTSAAVPVAAGAAALLLQANPALTWRDVRRLLAVTARRNHPTHPDWTLNGAGHPVNHDYGFGVIDATRAVQAAMQYDAGAPEVSFSSPLRTENVLIPDSNGTGITSSIDVTGSQVRSVDVVEVTVTITHPASGDLDVRLLHGATRSRLHPNHRCSPCSAINAFTFTSLRHLDEAGDGRWTLEVRDVDPQDVGRLVSWKLALYGRP
jgi:subtilisin family serine protease